MLSPTDHYVWLIDYQFPAEPRHRSLEEERVLAPRHATSTAGGSLRAADVAIDATRCHVCFLRYSVGKCRSARAGTSSSVDKVMTLGITIGRRSSRRQFGKAGERSTRTQQLETGIKRIGVGSTISGMRGLVVWQKALRTGVLLD